MNRFPRGPNMPGVVITCLFVWISTIPAVVVAFMTGQWLVLLWAVTACVIAAGWWMAVCRWLWWKAVAERLLKTLPDGLYHFQPPPEDE